VIEIDAAACREGREELGWTAAKLATAAGLTERTVTDFESGLRSPRPGTLIAIRRAFREAAARNASLAVAS